MSPDSTRERLLGPHRPHLLRSQDCSPSPVARFLLALTFILSPSLVLLHHLFLLLSSLALSFRWFLLLAHSPVAPGSVLLSSSPLSCLGLSLSPRTHPRALACFSDTGLLSQLLAMQSRQATTRHHGSRSLSYTPRLQQLQRHFSRYKCELVCSTQGKDVDR
ncbi:hypothetical protein BC826DRAFT_1002550 [Russula brevipes]|nr:hypothetical protein BC826DRAFT_1002550 [Russula brevipes]